MKVVSQLLKHVMYPALSRSGCLRRWTQPAPAVVTYHGILPKGYQPISAALDCHLVTAETFRSHLCFLQSNYKLISPQQFLAHIRGQERCVPGAVLLTCDDGLVNVYTEMLPIIRAKQLPMLLFLTGASTLDQGEMLWYEKLYLWLKHAKRSVCVELPEAEKAVTVPGNPDRQWPVLIRQLSKYPADIRHQLLREMRTQLGISEKWESEYSRNESLRQRFFVVNVLEAHELAQAGVTIGAHTLSHPMLSKMPEELAYAEMALSRERLQAATGMPVWAFAYPFGNEEAVGPREAELARRAGFGCAFVNTEAQKADGRFMIPRVHVSSDTTVAELDAHLSGFYSRMRAMV